MSIPSLLVFGPQTTWPSAEYLFQLRETLLCEPILKDLLSSIKELPKLWHDLVRIEPGLSQHSGTEHLDALEEWIERGAYPLSFDSAPPNIVSMPFTVIIHVVQYVRYLGTNPQSPTHVQSLAGAKDGGYQGFCIGLLSAMALGCASNEEDIGKLAGVALRLVFCIGAYTDLEMALRGEASVLAVRWQTPESHDVVLEILKKHQDSYISVVRDTTDVNITAPREAVAAISEELAAQGIVSKPTGLRGRCHSPSNQEALQKILDFCAKGSEMRFPDAMQLLVPVRSNTDARVLEAGPLHKLALEHILINIANWHLTMTAAVGAMITTDQSSAVVFGLVDCIPGSLIREHGLKITKWKNIHSLTSNSPSGSLSDVASGVATPSDQSVQDRSYPENAIAVVGMACKFPGAKSLEEFWELLAAGESKCQRIPQERFSTEGLRRSPDGKLKFWGNFVHDVDAFDHKFFKKSSREAASMDPQQRLLLEVAYAAMESSGYFGVSSSNPKNIGVYIGACSTDYNDNVASNTPTAYSSLGTLRAFLSGRISHFFNWTGPSITYDTACSSSAVAIDAACKALQVGDCTEAVAGGVSIFTSPNFYQNLAAASFLSSTGPTKPFDAKADGYCRGEGVGLVVLKKLSTALAEGNDVIGVIVGSSVNQNQNCTYITVPHGASQEALYTKVASLAEVIPHDVSYVEAHGTGTPVGDPIEFESIRKVFGGQERSTILNVASVKGNIGHLEGAAGVAALIKVCLMMQKKIIPLQANFSQLSPSIPALASDKMDIPTSTRPWDSEFKVACVNNYGAAGSNAAIVIREPPSQASQFNGQNEISEHRTKSKYPFYISANSLSSLSDYCTALLAQLQRPTPLTQNLTASVAFNLARKQNHSLPYHLAANVSNMEDIYSILTAAASGSCTPPITQLDNQERKPVVLCVGGQVKDFVGLDKVFYESSSLLRLHLDRCDSILRSSGLPSLYPGIFKSSSIEDVVELHVILFSLQYSCAQAWIESGLKICAVVGHSFGQLSALCISGVLSLQDGFRLVSGRANLMKTLWGPERGSMISIEADIDTMLELIAKAKLANPDFKIEIACYNGPTSHVLVGTSQAVDQFEGTLSNSSLKFKRLQVTHGFHSQFTEPLLPGLRELAKGLKFNEPKIPLETCSHGASWDSPTAELVAEHTRAPVYFSEAVNRISRRFGSCTWLEAGSSSSIIGMARRAVPKSPASTDLFLPMDLRTGDVCGGLVDTTVALWQAGHVGQFWMFHRSQKSQYESINLPPYQFERNRHWMEWKDTVHAPSKSIEDVSSHAREPVLLSFIRYRGQDQQIAEFKVDPRHEEYALYVQGHAVLAEPLCPAPLYMELASRAVSILHSKLDLSCPPSIEGLNIKAPLGMDLDRAICLVLREVEGARLAWQFEIISHPLDANPQTSKGTSHAIGIVICEAGDEVTDDEFARYQRLVDLPRFSALKDDIEAEAMQGSMIYKAFERVVIYAPYYKGVRMVASKDRKVVGTVSLPQHTIPALNKTSISPLAMDNFFQVAGLHVNTLNECADGEVFVCTKVDTIRVSRRFKPVSSNSWTVCSTFSPAGDRQIVNDIFVFDAKDQSLVVIGLGAHFTRVSINSLTKVLSRANKVKGETAKLSKDQSARTQGVVSIGHEDSTADGTFKLNGREPKQRTRIPEAKSSNIFRDVRTVLSKVSDLPVADIKDNSTLDDLGIDSLMIMEVLSEVESFFKTEIPKAEWQTLETPKLLAQYLETRLGGGGTQEFCNDSQSESDCEQVTSDSSVRSVETMATSLAGTPPRSFKSPLGNCPAILRTAQQDFEDIRHNYDHYTSRTGFKDFWEKVYPTQARLVLAYTVEAFQKLGCDLASIEAGKVIPPLKYLSRHELLVKQLFNILRDAFLVESDGLDYVRTGKSIDKTPSALILEEILSHFPQHAKEHKLLNITGSRLMECLAGIDDPLQLLFRDKANKQLLADVYAKGPMYEAISMLLGDFLVNALYEPSQSGSVEILEVGGGTGGTTAYLIDFLVKSNIAFTYTFTDIAGSLVTAAKRRFSGRGNMKFVVMDVEKPYPEEHLGKYHIVLSTNCVHATKDLINSTSNIRKLLRPDGFLSVVEFTRNMFWFDLVFGLLDGWWFFKDGREHVLADEWFWDKSMRAAGFKHVSWTDGASPEAQTLRIITAFAADAAHSSLSMQRKLKIPRFEHSVQTLQWKQEGNCKMMADIYLPPVGDLSFTRRPIALLVHGGGSILFTRKEVNPKQVKLLLDAGFLPVSIEYRFCPEVNILDGPMTDVCDAISWARDQLPSIPLDRQGIQVDPSKLVMIGWSTGGHLAMTTAFTTKQRGIQPPNAILSFYCPADYESDWWQSPIHPAQAVQSPDTPYDLLEGVQEEPISSYYPATNKNFPGMLMSLEDARWRFVLHMNWRAQTLPVLLNGLPSKRQVELSGQSPDDFYNLPMPSKEQIVSISPYSQIVRGNYTTPTFLIHGTVDDLIPWQHSQRIVDALNERGVESSIEVLDGVDHLFDTFSDQGWEEVQRGYAWLARQIFHN